MSGWTQDLRFAMRRLRLEPGYAAFVALTLALGIGANVAVFSVVDGVLLRSLPFYQADRLIGVWGRFLPESGFDFPQFVLSNHSITKSPEQIQINRIRHDLITRIFWMQMIPSIRLR